MSGTDILSDVLGHAPELQTSPELALAASSDQTDPRGTSRALAHTSNTAANDRAVRNVSKKVGHPSLLHRTLGFLGGSISKANHAVEHVPGVKGAEHAVGTIGGDALKLANVGLSEVQHSYRALHDIEARHGVGVGLLEALGIGAAGVLAGAAAPFTAGGSLAAFAGATAGILGAEAAADVSSRVFYKDSWDRTQNGEAYRGIYNRQTGKYSGGPVSLGRDLVDHLPHPLRFMSGITDGLADLTLDPLAVVGGGLAEARHAGLLVNTVEQLDHALADPIVGKSVWRAFGDIAKDTSETSIRNKYPKFAGLESSLASTRTADDVAEKFRGLLAAGEHLDSYPGELPNLPLSRIPFKKAQQFIREYNGPGSASLRVFQLLPTAWDDKLLAFSRKDFDPSGKQWTQGVYRALRMGQSDETARLVTDAMLATNDLGIRRDLYKNGIISMMRSRGLGENDEFFRNMVQELENTTPLGGGPEAIYGASSSGRNLSQIPVEGGGVRSVAILENQTGRCAFPDFMEMTRAVRAQGKITDLLGAADDAFYHHFTQAVFKRGALLTGGFALRIAAAEALPAAFREGFLNLIKNSVDLHLGAYEAKIGSEEAGHIAAAVHKMTGWARRPNAEDIDLFTRATIDNRSHIVVRGLDADAHGASGVSFLDTPEGNKTTVLQRLFNKVPEKNRYGKKFGVFGAGPDHTDAWTAALRESANSELATTAADKLHFGLTHGQSLDDATQSATDAVKNLLDSKDARFLGKFERHFTPSVDGIDPHEDWAKVVVDHVKGVVGNPYDEQLKMDLLHKVSMGETPSVAELKAFDPAEVPMVKGRILMPPTYEGPIDKIAQLGYTKVIDPIINFMSREPLYATELKRQYQPLKHLIADGTLAEDEALRIAQIRSVKAVMPFIHNPLERSQFAELSHNFMPFYFAQTQAYRRVGRLLADDPGAFRKFQLASSALHDIGTVTTDDNGQPQFVYPGSGFLAHASVGALGMLGFQVAGSTPVAFSGEIRSLKVIFPFSEDSGGLGVGPFKARFGPIVSIPLHALETMFPEVGHPLANSVLGEVGAAGGLVDQLIPNTPIRNLLKAGGYLPGGQKELGNAMMQTIQSLSYQQETAMRKWVASGHQPTDPGHPHLVPLPGASALEQQQFVTRVRNQSRILLFLKAGLSMISPAAPQVSANDLGLTEELRKLIASKGPDGKPLGLSGAITEFLHRHPDATPYTVFGSQSDAGGAYLPANKSAQNFLDAHLDLLKKYPYAGAWLIPQTDDPYNQAIYSEQLAMGLRHKKAPEQVLKDTYTAQGNRQFYEIDLPAHKKALAAADGDSEATKAENANFNSYLQNTLGAQNPVWWDDFQSANREHERTNAVKQLTSMFQNGDAPSGPQTALVKSLLDDYRTHLNTVTSGRQDSWSADERDAEKANWQAYLDVLAKQHPEIAPLIYKVFRSL